MSVSHPPPPGCHDTDRIGSLALRALLCEVAATPKPGLVDRDNAGAHQDMDYFTFMSSCAAIAPYLTGFAERGAAGARRPPMDLFPELQAYGREAERAMLLATDGVNTHKGAIFSLGLLCASAAVAAQDGEISAENVCRIAAGLCRDICRAAFERLLNKDKRTKGEEAYLRHGMKGVRGEAECGYATVRTLSLPAYRDLRRRGFPLNDALCQTLLHLMAEVPDTNVVMRCGTAAADYVKLRARQVLGLGGMWTPEGRTAVRSLDGDFIERNISPGGCADLLAVTQFLHDLENRSPTSD